MRKQQFWLQKTAKLAIYIYIYNYCPLLCYTQNILCNVFLFEWRQVMHFMLNKKKTHAHKKCFYFSSAGTKNVTISDNVHKCYFYKILKCIKIT